MDSLSEPDSNELRISTEELMKLHQLALAKETGTEDVLNKLLLSLLEEKYSRVDRDMLIAASFLDLSKDKEILEAQISEHTNMIKMLINRTIGLSIGLLAVLTILAGTVFAQYSLRELISTKIQIFSSELRVR